MARSGTGPVGSPQARLLRAISDGKYLPYLLAALVGPSWLSSCGPTTGVEPDGGLPHHGPLDDGGPSPVDDAGLAEPDPPPSDGGAGLFTDAGGDGGMESPPGPEVVHVQGQGLRLVGAGPALSDGCDAPCDLDEDGLVDAWEDAVLAAFVPALRLDPEEPLLDDAGAVTAAVGRVMLVQPAPLVVRAFIMLGYSEDYGSCGLTSHHGDSERVALEVWAVPGGDAGDVEMARAYTAAHEGTVTDRGRVFSGAEIGGLIYQPDPTTGVPRWTVFPSQRKHATYATPELCAGAFALPCFAETCASVDTGILVTLPVVNAGEDGARLVEALDFLGFEGETAWGEQRFCGGTPEGSCSSPVREKLLVDPFL